MLGRGDTEHCVTVLRTRAEFILGRGVREHWVSSHWNTSRSAVLGRRDRNHWVTSHWNKSRSAVLARRDREHWVTSHWNKSRSAALGRCDREHWENSHWHKSPIFRRADTQISYSTGTSIWVRRAVETVTTASLCIGSTTTGKLSTSRFHHSFIINTQTCYSWLKRLRYVTQKQSISSHAHWDNHMQMNLKIIWF